MIDLPRPQPMPQVSVSLAAGIAYLARTQHAAGNWTDFWLPVGTSDAWVTAYIGLALHRASTCSFLDQAARRVATNCTLRAAEWLLQQPRPYSGWGYNARVRPDADTTAHALSLLAGLQLAVPGEAVAFLREHETPGMGFKTYNWRNPIHKWTHPCTDVSAAVLRALHDVGALDQIGLRAAWQEILGAVQDDHGWWNGYWWMTPNYTTGLVLEVWDTAERPGLLRPPACGLPQGCAFDLAWALCTSLCCCDEDNSLALTAQLIALQEIDGGWPSAPILRVPPAYERAGPANRTLVAGDARRLFTTATAIRALAFASERLELPPISGTCFKYYPSERSVLGYALDQLVYQAAQALGFTLQGAEEARHTFNTLTYESLAAPCPWPATQLSTLAGGRPLEFSVTVGEQVKPALRYTTEVGNPLLPPYPRGRAGIIAVARTAQMLGYNQAWQRVLPAVEQVISLNVPVPDDLRFWIWSGVDQNAPNANGIQSPPGVKIYLNLLHVEVGEARPRLEAALCAAAIPLSDDLRTALDTLDTVGFLHEFGFGLGPGGKIACKIYYELHGWRRLLVRQLLEQVGLPGNPDTVCPEIPGILRETLSAKSRAGIALRIDPENGRVRELTTAAAFPPPLLSPAETCGRVAAWIDDHGWDGTAYRALSNLLLPAWEADGALFGRMHGLFTRTVSAKAAWSTVYLRPFVGDSPLR